MEGFISILYPVLAAFNSFLGANQMVPTYVFHLNALEHSPEEREPILSAWFGYLDCWCRGISGGDCSLDGHLSTRTSCGSEGSQLAPGFPPGG